MSREQDEKNRRKAKRREKLFHLFDGRCFYCEVEMTLEFKDGKSLPYDHTCTVDHIYPRTDIRRSDPDAEANRIGMNKVAACYLCNNTRGDEDFVVFYQRKKREIAHARCALVPA